MLHSVTATRDLIARLSGAVALAADDSSDEGIDAAAATLPQIDIICTANASVSVLGLRYLRTRVAYTYTMGHRAVADLVAPMTSYALGDGGLHVTSFFDGTWHAPPLPCPPRRLSWLGRRWPGRAGRR